MGVLKASVELPADSGLPEDAAFNNFHFITPGAGPPSLAQIAAVHTALTDFYIVTYPGNPSPLSAYFAPCVDQLATNATYYDAEAGGSPLQAATPMILSPPGASRCEPSEVALCLSFRGDYAGVVEEVPLPPAGPSGDLHPRARRRGRVYLGPLNDAAVAAGSGRPTPEVRDAARDAAEALRDATVLSSSGIDWAVWSPTNGSAVAVVAGWVDDAFDTQRRRGVAPTVRLTF